MNVLVDNWKVGGGGGRGEQEERRFLAVGDEEDAELAAVAESDCPHVPFEIVKRTELGQMAVREGGSKGMRIGV